MAPPVGLPGRGLGSSAFLASFFVTSSTSSFFAKLILCTRGGGGLDLRTVRKEGLSGIGKCERKETGSRAGARHVSWQSFPTSPTHRWVGRSVGRETPQDVGPFFRRNFISRGIGIGQNKPWLPTPDPKPTPAWLGGAIALPTQIHIRGLRHWAGEPAGHLGAESPSRRTAGPASARKTSPPCPH